MSIIVHLLNWEPVNWGDRHLCLFYSWAKKIRGWLPNHGGVKSYEKRELATYIKMSIYRWDGLPVSVELGKNPTVLFDGARVCVKKAK